MRKYIYLTLLLFSMTFFVACSQRNFIGISQSIISSLHTGMDMKDIRQKLGDPDFRRFDNDCEEWEYRFQNAFNGRGEQVMLLRFVDGKLIYMDTFLPKERIPAFPAVVGESTPAIETALKIGQGYYFYTPSGACVWGILETPTIVLLKDGRRVSCVGNRLQTEP